MSAWFKLRFGFSWMGLLYLACLFIPNILFTKHMPPDFAGVSAREPAGLLAAERVGQAAVCVLVLFTRDLRPEPWSSWSWWLIAGWVLMALYDLCWWRYLAGPASSEAMYSPFLGVPVPLAVLPVAAVLLFGVYARSLWLILAGTVLGVGHIGIHLFHLHALNVAQ